MLAFHNDSRKTSHVNVLALTVVYLHWQSENTVFQGMMKANMLMMAGGISELATWLIINNEIME